MMEVLTLEEHQARAAALSQAIRGLASGQQTGVFVAAMMHVVLDVAEVEPENIDKIKLSVQMMLETLCNASRKEVVNCSEEAAHLLDQFRYAATGSSSMGSLLAALGLCTACVQVEAEGGNKEAVSQMLEIINMAHEDALALQAGKEPPHAKLKEEVTLQ